MGVDTVADKRRDQERAAEMIRDSVSSLNTALGWASTLGIRVRLQVRIDDPMHALPGSLRVLDQDDALAVISIIAEEQL